MHIYSRRGEEQLDTLNTRSQTLFSTAFFLCRFGKPGNTSFLLSSPLSLLHLRLTAFVKVQNVYGKELYVCVCVPMCIVEEAVYTGIECLVPMTYVVVRSG